MSCISKIGVVTSTRAEYGLFYPFLKELKKLQEFQLLLFVTGTHLSYEFGFTKNQIIDDGFKICEEIDCIVGNDTPQAIGKSSGLALMGMTDAFCRNKPDLLFVLGDRYEILCTAVSANICNIPIAHIHGGEITEGAADNNFRHAITKLSYFHFTSTEEYRQRVIQMGEYPERVFNVGAIGIDNLKNIEPIKKEKLENDLGISFLNRNVLLTIHPETLSPGTTNEHIKVIIDCLKEMNDTFIIITGTNADSEGRLINRELKDFSKNNEHCYFIENLGLHRYISILNYVDLVIGNSSSGIIEVPSFGIPTINIGDRQKGRIRSKSIVDVDWNKYVILSAIKNCTKENYHKIINPYGDGHTTMRIIDQLQKIKINENYKKKFYDYKGFK